MVGRTVGQRDTLDIAARNDRSQSLQYPNGWFRFVHGRGKLMLPCCVTGQVLQIRVVLATCNEELLLNPAQLFSSTLSFL